VNLVIQNPYDRLDVGTNKTPTEFEAFHEKILAKSGIEFPNKKSGRITGVILPDKIDPKEKWLKHLLTTIDRNYIKLGVVETEYLLTNTADFYISLSCSPSKSINGGRNDKPVSFNSLIKFINRIESVYCLDANELIIHGLDPSFIAQTTWGITNAFKNGWNVPIVFMDKKMTPFFNDQNHQLMGYLCSKSHFDFKFYLIDMKYQEDKYQFRIERSYTRMATLKRSTCINTLHDLRSLEVAFKCVKKILGDFDDLIISDSTIRPPNNLSKKQLTILKNSSNPNFWLDAIKNKDKNTYRDWVNTFRKLSDNYGNGFHSQIRNLILDQLNEIKEELEKQNRRNSPHVTGSYGVTSSYNTKDCINNNNNQYNMKIKEINKEKSKKQLAKEKRALTNNQVKSFMKVLSATLQLLEKKVA
jgi:hypothetical protein